MDEWMNEYMVPVSRELPKVQWLEKWFTRYTPSACLYDTIIQNKVYSFRVAVRKSLLRLPIVTSSLSSNKVTSFSLFNQGTTEIWII